MTTAQTLFGALSRRGAIDPHLQLVVTQLDASAKAPKRRASSPPT